MLRLLPIAFAVLAASQTFAENRSTPLAEMLGSLMPDNHPTQFMAAMLGDLST